MTNFVGRSAPIRLHQYLLDQLMYHFDQEQYGHPGFLVIRRNIMADLGVTEDELKAMIYELENWSDFNCIPSLTCLLRIPVAMGGTLCYHDLHTHLSAMYPNHRIQRHLVEMRKHEGNQYRLFVVKVSGVDDKDPLDIHNIEGLLDKPMVLERDKVYALYRRLAQPVNVENALVMTPFQN